MVALYANPALDLARREFLAYGLAKVFDDLGVPYKAVTYAIEANRLGARPFDMSHEAAAVDKLSALAAENAFRHARRSGHPSRAPLFIVGMPRSGTTLVESILSRHTDVFAQGETGNLAAVEADGFVRLGLNPQVVGRHQMALALQPDWLTARAEALLQRARATAGRTFGVITDKLLENAVRLGQLKRPFPNARVIHVRRHPLDTGISNFFQRFSSGQGYSNRLDWIERRSRQVADSMAIWKRALDLQILDVSYEKLVADPESEARRLVAFASLEWTDACLEPQHTQRSVLTVSQWQARQPINRRSVDRWRRYEPWIGPMVEAMGGFEWIDQEVASVLG